MRALDATILREFVDRIDVTATEKWKKIQDRKIHIVYNFIGAFDFEAVTAAHAETDNNKRKSA